MFFRVSRADINQFDCETNEDITAVKSLHDLEGPGSGAFCVGTLRAHVAEREPSLGRLLLFEITAYERKLKSIAVQEVDGCVYAIDTVNNLIAAAVNTSVCLSPSKIVLNIVLLILLRWTCTPLSTTRTRNRHHSNVSLGGITITLSQAWSRKAIDLSLVMRLALCRCWKSRGIIWRLLHGIIHLFGLRL